MHRSAFSFVALLLLLLLLLSSSSSSMIGLCLWYAAIGKTIDLYFSVICVVYICFVSCCMSCILLLVFVCCAGSVIGHLAIDAAR
jgi:hypothetical protein